MVHEKVTYYKMLASERWAKLAAEARAVEARRAARIAADQPPSSPKPSSDEEESEVASMDEGKEDEMEINPVAGFRVAGVAAYGGDNIRLLSMEEAKEQLLLA